MDSKSWPSFQNRASSGQLGRRTDPGFYTWGRRRTSFKRSSEDSLEGCSKRSRTSQSPSESFSRWSSGPASSDDSYTTAFTSLPDSTGSRKHRSLSGPREEALSGTVEKKTSSKRKSTAEEREEEPKKRSRRTPTPAKDHAEIISLSSTSIIAIDSSKSEEQRSKKRKSEETQEPRKRSRKTPYPSEDPSCQNTAEASTSEQPTTSSSEQPATSTSEQPTTSSSEQPTTSSSEQPATSSSPESFPRHSRAAFEAKYEEDKNNMLGSGGFGVVFAGHRKEDSLPVAIKHLPQIDIQRISLFLDEKLQNDIPQEVALLLKVRPQAGETSAVVALLDWYDLDYELILVLERPVPCMDLTSYVTSRRSALPEEEVKNITKQLVDALIEIHSKGVFHGDIKLDNILIETGSDVPRVRIIDFGYGEFLSDGIYVEEQATHIYSSPEWFLSGWYRAEPTTVWQLGVVLFGMLHNFFPFGNAYDIVDKNPAISDTLSLDCQGFLQSCLAKAPEARATLGELKNHPWLMDPE